MQMKPYIEGSVTMGSTCRGINTIIKESINGEA